MKIEQFLRLIGLGSSVAGCLVFILEFLGITMFWFKGVWLYEPNYLIAAGELGLFIVGLIGTFLSLRKFIFEGSKSPIN